MPNHVQLQNSRAARWVSRHIAARAPEALLSHSNKVVGVQLVNISAHPIDPGL